MDNFASVDQRSDLIATDEVIQERTVFKMANKQLENMPRDDLKKIHFRAYAVGHFANDLCAACWFTYVLYYVKEVVGLSKYAVG
jgi:hypothetical protein